MVQTFSPESISKHNCKKLSDNMSVQMAKLAKILLLLSFLQGSVFAAIYNWEYVSPSAAVLLRPNPDGFQNNEIHLYLCRVLAWDWRWIPGKLIISPNSTACHFAIQSTENFDGHFQMLITPPGVLSWTPYHDTIRDHAVVAGAHGDDAPSYACRALYQGHLLLGVLSYFDGDCYMAIDGGEVSTSEEIEVLVVNTYGRLIEEPDNGTEMPTTSNYT